MSLVESWSLNQTTTVEVAHPGVQGVPGAVSSVNSRTGAVVLTSADVGLSNVNNTSDANKPVSTAQAAADAAVLSSANATTAAHAGRTDNPHNVSAAQLGLGSVENKSSATIRGEITGGNVTTALGYTPENAAQKGAAGGYAPLDGTGKVASTYLPSYVDDVLEFANLAAFPVTGETGKMYVVLDTNKVYRWSGSAYVEISGSPGSTDAVPEGASNLYFTAARVLGTVLSGLSTATNAVITAADTVLSALGKLQKQISDNLTTLTNHTSNTSNPHATTAAQVGAVSTGAVTTSGLTMSTARLLGRNTASTGAIEEITIGTNLSMSGTTLNATGGDFKSDGTVAGTGNFSTTGSMRADGGFNANSDTFLQRVAAASWRLGAADAATPVAQTLSAQSVVAGTTNAAGANWTFRGSLSTGTGAPGKFVFQIGNTSTSGSTQNAPVTATTVEMTTWTPGTGTYYAAILPGGSANTGILAYSNTDLNFGLTSNIYFRVSPYSAAAGWPYGPAMIASASGAFGWASVAGATNSLDTAFFRVGVKQVALRGAGATTDYGDFYLRSLIATSTITLGNVTVATLPTAASNTHAIIAVTDGNASPTYRGAVTGGGSTKGVVYCDGSSWMWH